MHPDPVGFEFFDFDGVETGRHIGTEIFGTADFIEQLGRHGSDGDLAPRALMLANHRRAIGGDIRPGKARPDHARNLGEERVIPPGSLGAALDDVPRGHRPCQLIPIVALPLVMPGGRAADHRGVGGSARDHDIGPHIQGLYDSPAAEIGVGREKGGLLDGISRLEMAKLIRRKQILHLGHQVITRHIGNRRAQAQLIRDFGHGIRAAIGVEAARIGHHLDALIEAGTHDLLHLHDEGPRVSAPRTLGLGARENQHGEFGQPIPGEEIDLAPFDHLACGR